MGVRRCLDCSEVGSWDRSGRCPTHKRLTNNARDRKPERVAHKAARYDSGYRAIRKAWANQIALGVFVRCARCREQITGAFDLDHIGDALLPSHPHCNRSAK